MTRKGPFPETCPRAHIPQWPWRQSQEAPGAPQELGSAPGRHHRGAEGSTSGPNAEQCMKETTQERTWKDKEGNVENKSVGEEKVSLWGYITMAVKCCAMDIFHLPFQEPRYPILHPALCPGTQTFVQQETREQEERKGRCLLASSFVLSKTLVSLLPGGNRLFLS